MINAPWKLGTYAGFALSAGLAIALFLADARADRLSVKLTVAQTDVATCTTNTKRLKDDLATQNQKIADLNTAYAQGQKIGQQQIAQAQRAAQSIRFTPPRASGLEARVLEVDARILGELK